jgi:hypothetical protein
MDTYDDFYLGLDTSTGDTAVCVSNFHLDRITQRSDWSGRDWTKSRKGAKARRRHLPWNVVVGPRVPAPLIKNLT